MAIDAGAALAFIERWGYWLVFVTGVAEAMPILGIFVPGHIVLVIAGAAASAGYLDIRMVIAVAVPAAILGDVPGFYLGRRYGRGFVQRLVARVPSLERSARRSDELFERRGAMALVACRFNNVTRAIGPVFAGISRMRVPTFWAYNVAGAILWGVGMALAGYFFGRSFLYVQGVVGQILAITLLAVGGLFLFYRALRKLSPQFTRDDFLLTLTGIAAGVAFGLLADAVARRGVATLLDAPQQSLVSLVAPAAPALALVARLLSFEAVAALALVATAVFAVRRRTWEALLVALGVGGATLLAGVVRAALSPIVALDGFPSTDAAVVVVAAGAAAYVAAARWRGAWLGATIGGASAVSAIAALVFAAAGAQATDVLAGLLLGIVWLSVSILVVEFGVKRAA